MAQNPFYPLFGAVLFIPLVLFVLFFPAKVWGILYLSLAVVAFILHLKGERLKVIGYLSFLPALFYTFTHLKVNHIVEDLFFLSTSFIILFLLSERNFRNYFYLSLLSFLNLTLVSVNFQNLSYGILLLVYLFGLVYLFLLLALGGYEKILPRRVYIWLLKYSSVTYTVILLFASVLFFLLPRPSQPLFTLFQKQLPQTKIGFSSDIRLGAFSSVARDNTVVFRAKISEIPKEGLYWRGNTLEIYRKGMWFTYPSFYASYRWIEGAKPVRELILLNPYGDTSIFTYKYPVRVLHSNIKTSIDLAKGIVKALEPFNKLVKIELLATDRIEVYLRNPQPLLEIPPDLRPLLGNIVARYGLAGVDLNDTLRRLGKYFSSFRYSVTTKAHNLEEFLTKYKEGDCEFFATAAALILRYLGYPTRVVVGFYGGDYNTLTGFYVVRQKDAHAWVEIYHNHRWIRFDGTSYAIPTPSVKEEARSNLEQNKLLLIWDTLNTLWLEYVVNLTKAKQKKLWSKLSAQVEKVREGNLRLPLAVLLGIVFAVALYVIRRLYPSLLTTIYLRLKYGIREVSPSMSKVEIYSLLWRRYPDIWRVERRRLLRF